MKTTKKASRQGSSLQNIRIDQFDRGKYKQLPRNLKALKELKSNCLAAKHPTVPPYALPKGKPYNDRTANGLTRCILDAINLSGGQAERISNTGRTIDNTYTYVDVLGQKKTIGGVKFIPGTGTNGTADISATIAGKSIKIEVKVGKDKLSDAQERYRESIEAAGGMYIIGRSYTSFVEELERRLE